MRFMVIETYLHGARPVYERLQEGGRRIPDGVAFVESWVDEDLGRCWQLMDAERREDLDAWIEAWSDLVAFEVVPVVSSDEARRATVGSPRA